MSQFLTRYGDEITGVHCANDTIAYGVLDALRRGRDRGDAGRQLRRQPGSGGIRACRARSSPPSFTNPYWGGGITAALAYHAAIGTFKPSDEPHEHREFYGPTILITAADAAEFKAKYIDATPTYDWTDFWGPSNGQIHYKLNRNTRGGAHRAPSQLTHHGRDPGRGRAQVSERLSRETLIKWAPLLVLVALIAVFTAINPELPVPAQHGPHRHRRHARADGRDRRDLHHHHGVHRPFDGRHDVGHAPWSSAISSSPGAARCSPRPGSPFPLALALGASSSAFSPALSTSSCASRPSWPRSPWASSAPACRS